MNGRETYKQAVTSMMRAAGVVLERCGITADDITCVIPHQANLRIIEAMADRMGLGLDRFHINLDKYGNTSAAAVAIALDEAARSGRFQIGDPILLVVFGGGLTYASAVIEW
jgi:3-oxoacyl-[acyl-carrier-protein] synthase-3